jgi:hypothetical protein
MRDCYRCLERGGLLRLALPDFRLDLDAYLSGDWAYVAEFDRVAAPALGEGFDLIRGMPPELRGRTIADYLNFFIYQYGEHKTIYDHRNASSCSSTSALPPCSDRAIARTSMGATSSARNIPSTCRP